MTQVAYSQTSGLAETYRDEVERLVGDDLLQDALDHLQDFARDLAPSMKSDVLVLRRRNTNFARDLRRGMARREEINPIVIALLDLNAEIYRIASTTGSPQSPPAARQPATTPKLVPEGAAIAAIAPPTVVKIVERAPPQPAKEPDLRLPAKEPAADATASARVPANDAGDRKVNLTLEDVQRSYWRTYRTERPRDETVAFAAKDVTKSYRRGGFVLKPISFELRVGEITGVIGRNASGKTTLLQIILGALSPDSGRTEYPALTRVGGKSWVNIKRQMADVAQLPDRWPGKLRPNLCYVAAMHGIRGKENEQLIDWHLERYGLTDYESSAWEEISGGYKVRFELVRALVTRPRLLVLDEPLAYLDVIARQEFLKNLRAIAASMETPLPIIITSQHLYEIEAVADQMILLDNGDCVFAGNLEDIAQKVKTKNIEVTLKAPQPAVAAALKHLKLIAIDGTVEGYILSFESSQKPDAVYIALYQAFGDKLVDFRDISSSSRSLFGDRGAGL